MKRFMEAAQFDLTATLKDILGLEPHQLNDLYDKLHFDDVARLVDAASNGDHDTVKEIASAHIPSSDVVKSEEDKVEGTDVDADQNEAETESDEEDTDDATDGLTSKKSDSKSKKDKKNKPTDDDDLSSRTFSIGDPIIVDGEKATVKIPKGPNNTLGVMIDGELKMIDKAPKKKKKAAVSETMAAEMNSLARRAGLTVKESFYYDDFGLEEATEIEDAHVEPVDEVDADFEDEFNGDMDRMRELAGIKPDFKGHDYAGAELGGVADLDASAVPAPQAFNDLDIDLADDLPPMPELEAEGVDSDAEISDLEHVDLDAEIAADLDAAKADLDSALGVPATAPVSTPANSGADVVLDAVERAAAEIEASLPNAKLSSYKAIVSRLEALLAATKAAGKEAVFESRRQRLAAKMLAETEKQFGSQAKMFGDEEDAVGEGKLHAKEDALDTDGDKEVEEPKEKGKERKTLLDYVKESESQTLGNQADALKSIQARMGNNANSQDARKAFDAMVKSGTLRSQGGKYEMDAMGDEDFQGVVASHAMAASDEQETGSTNKPNNPLDPKQNKPAGSNTVNNKPSGTVTTSSSTGGANGYQGQ